MPASPPQPPSPKVGNGFINLFASHRVAANLLMLSMIFIGLWALTRLNVQFLPTFIVNEVSIEVPFRGANAEDIQRSITIPIEQEIRDLDYIKEIRSTSRLGISIINVEFEQGTDMGEATERVRERVGLVRDLPQGIEPPRVSKREHYDPIAKLIVQSPGDLEEIRPIIHRIERELLDNGIAKITVRGLPDIKIAVYVDMPTIAELRVSLNEIASVIARRSRDVPAGTIGERQATTQVRAIEQQRSIRGFRELPVLTDRNGQLVRLGDIAKVEKAPRSQQIKMKYNDDPAVELQLLRSVTSNSLTSAKILREWLESEAKKLPETVTLQVYDESWRYVKGRINLLLKNGAGGLILILGVLFLFLNSHIAFWVAVGIPTSFLAALSVLYLAGGSINMVSLFAMIMALGIIVDDTIVVSEETLSLVQRDVPSLQAVQMGAHRMLSPVMASSLTTISAFLPLMLIGDNIGTILFDIPLVVISVIIASLLECFLVLPGHLYHSFRRKDPTTQSEFRQQFNKSFTHFRENKFRKLASYAIHAPYTTLACAFSSFAISVTLVIGGWVNFNFFPSPDGRMIYAVANFSAASSDQEKLAFIDTLKQSLEKTLEEYPTPNGTKSLVQTKLSIERYDPLSREQGSGIVSYAVELLEPDDRTVTNKQFIETWRNNTTVPANVESFTITAPRAGPPGKDIDIKISGGDTQTLKNTAETVKNLLRQFPGVSDVQDDMPFGQTQLIFSLKPEGRAIGLTTESVGEQVRAAFTGVIAQIYFEEEDEYEVRVQLPPNESEDIFSLAKLPIITAENEVVLLENVADFKQTKGVDILRRSDTKLSVNVTAEVDATQTNANKVLSVLEEQHFGKIASESGVDFSLAGRSEEQADTLSDMKYGLILALAMVYIILAWVFSSYLWPFAVMLAIPIGLSGAIFGHLVMGIDLTILSLFGFFGLSGIVINDSIILITRFRELLHDGQDKRQAIIDASCQRLRAVLLTSLTTIGGLTPLLFERSLQAQFLIPMATSICFGLAFATLLILLVVPATLVIIEDWLGERLTEEI